MQTRVKTPFLLLGLIALTIPRMAHGAPDFSLVGFATQNGGTTGGKAGTTVTVSTYADLKSYAENATAHVIMVKGTITNGAAGGQIRVKSNKSIIGIGSTAFLQGVGLDISSQNNVIVRNLKMTLVGTTTPANVNGGDVLSISGTSKNIWIDHCELYSEDPSVQTDKDMYDGLLDIKGQTGFITLSWNYLHDHHKGGLVGAADDDLNADRKVTMHHNHYRKVLLRVPMYRGATGHFFNNYIVGAKDATEIRAGTCVRVEKNYYESLNYSIYTPSDSPGKTERIDNVEVKRASRAYPAACVADIPYKYDAVLTSVTNDVKTIVPQYAGVGKITTDGSVAIAAEASTVGAVLAQVRWIDGLGNLVKVEEQRLDASSPKPVVPAGLRGLHIARVLIVGQEPRDIRFVGGVR
ncbi:MAG: hypothetical protein RL318_541 [Fibrobacterota bacterium]|jgi:pectate lyase